MRFIVLGCFAAYSLAIAAMLSHLIYVAIWERHLRKLGKTINWQEVERHLEKGVGCISVVTRGWRSQVWFATDDKEFRTAVEVLSEAQLVICARRLKSASVLRELFPKIRVMELTGVEFLRR